MHDPGLALVVGSKLPPVFTGELLHVAFVIEHVAIRITALDFGCERWRDGLLNLSKTFHPSVLGVGVGGREFHLVAYSLLQPSNLTRLTVAYEVHRPFRGEPASLKKCSDLLHHLAVFGLGGDYMHDYESG